MQKKRIICVGNRYRPEDSAGPMVYDQLVNDKLPKDIEVIDLLAQDKMTKESSDHLNKSKRTVVKQIDMIYKKIGVRWEVGIII